MRQARARQAAKAALGLGGVRRLRKSGLRAAECAPYASQSHMQKGTRKKRECYAWQRLQIKNAVKKAKKLALRRLRDPNLVLRWRPKR